jgi:hypothetical protein
VVETRKRNDSAAGRGVVVWIEARHAKRAVQSEFRTQRVGVTESTLQPKGRPEGNQRSRPLFAANPKAPESHPQKPLNRPVADIPLHGEGHGPVTEAERRHGDLAPPAGSANFTHKPHEPNTAKGDPEAELGRRWGILCDFGGWHLRRERTLRPERSLRAKRTVSPSCTRVRGADRGVNQKEGDHDDERHRDSQHGRAFAEGKLGAQRNGMRLTWATALLFAVVGCGDPEGIEGIPAEAREWLAVDRASSQVVTPGVHVHQIRSGREPWTVHLLEVDLSQCQLGFRVARVDSTSTTLANPSGAGAERRRVQDFLRDDAARGVAALNGDFYTEENLPIGLDASAGELRGRVPRPVFAWRPREGVYVGPVQWAGDTLQLGSWQLVRGEADGQTELLSGFPALLLGGEVVGDLEVAGRPAFAAERHPRTAVGWDPVRGRLWGVVVDGRREGVAEGMTLPELAGLLRALGVTDAINLDGGGSSVLVVRGRVASRPSDPAGARPVVNALVVLEDEAFCAVAPGSG